MENTQIINKQKRGHRFVRQEPEPIKLQERDLNILWLACNYRLVDSKQIAYLTDSSQQTVNVRLRKLWKGKFLDRPLAQRELVEPPLGTRPMVYALASRGAAKLKKYIKEPIKWSHKKVQSEHIEHTLMISQFRAVITLACKDNHYSKLYNWTREDRQELRDKTFEIKNNERIVYPIYPDSFFSLEVPPDSGRGKHFFLEADNNTTHPPIFGKKVRGYFVWRARNGMDNFGISDFRVLIICEEQKRMEKLMKATQEAVEMPKLFWFATLDNFKLDNPQTALGRIWRIPLDNKLHSVLE